MLGMVLGPALQLQQPSLWFAQAYVGVLAFGLVGLGLFATRQRPRVLLPIVLAATFVSFGLCGLRAVAFSAQALAPELEGRDVVVTGVVAAMPQGGESGQRFRFEVERAELEGPAAVPPLLALGWYAGPPAGSAGAAPQKAAALLRAGERWRLTVRLRAPHGNVNPHGFDQELWLWEQGVQATGYVRTGPADPAPVRLAATWRHPVEQARQAVRDAIQSRIGDRRSAGIVAALVVGDQNAIELGSSSNWLLLPSEGERQTGRLDF